LAPFELDRVIGRMLSKPLDEDENISFEVLK
jgi:hypothetical protein